MHPLHLNYLVSTSNDIIDFHYIYSFRQQTYNLFVLYAGPCIFFIIAVLLLKLSHAAKAENTGVFLSTYSSTSRARHAVDVWRVTLNNIGDIGGFYYDSCSTSWVILHICCFWLIAKIAVYPNKYLSELSVYKNKTSF